LLIAALSQLERVKKEQIDDLRHTQKPVREVVLVMEALCKIFNEEDQVN